MAHGLFWLRRPSEAQLHRVLDEQSRLPLSYEPVGMTRDDRDQPGYHGEGGSIDLGSGREMFDTATQALRRWQVHERAGLRVVPENTEVTEGSSVIMVFLRIAGYVTLACRVVYVIDTADQWGFAYGTLLHHPEQGEERFVVSIDNDERVTFTVSALSRPGHIITTIGAPVGRAVQRAMTKRYLTAMEELAR